jgi:ketosteroid isomerase-like protein
MFLPWIALAKTRLCHYGMAHGFHLAGLQPFRRRKPEMTFPAAQSFSTRLHRLRWVLYVVLALVGGSLTFVGAHAQQKATEEATFRKLLDSYCAAWSSGNPDNAAKFYAKEDGLVFYDLAPFSYHGWKEYRVGVQKQFFDNASAAKLTAGKDLKVSRRGNIAWMTVPMHISLTTKDGKTSETEVRYTGIWEKRGAAWLLVHEHLSVPMG